MKNTDYLELPRPLSDDQLESLYNQMLDDCTEPATALGITVAASEFVKTHDPVAYRCGLSDWLGTDDRVVEFEREYYDGEEFRDAVAEAIDKVVAEIERLEEEREALEDERNWPRATELAELETVLEKLESLK